MRLQMRHRLLKEDMYQGFYTTGRITGLKFILIAEFKRGIPALMGTLVEAKEHDITGICSEIQAFKSRPGEQTYKVRNSKRGGMDAKKDIWVLGSLPA